jgi:hypothetical protein
MEPVRLVSVLTGGTAVRKLVLPTVKGFVTKPTATVWNVWRSGTGTRVKTNAQNTVMIKAVTKILERARAARLVTLVTIVLCPAESVMAKNVINMMVLVFSVYLVTMVLDVVFNVGETVLVESVTNQVACVP